ncbi:MAG: FxLYD domain-containing protein [bacterium]
MPLFIVAVAFLCLLGASPTWAEEKFYLNSIEYLQAEPEGDKLGQLFQGIELEKLSEKGDWAEVRLTGWLKTSWLSTQSPQTRKYKPPLEIINLEDRFSDYGDYIHILGEVKNQGPQDYKFLLVTVTFYDQDKKIVDTTTTLISSLKKGEVRPFKTISKNHETIKIYKAKVEPVN